MRNRHLVHAAGILGLAAALAPPALAQPDGALDGPALAERDLVRLVRDLDADDATTRENASAVLASDPRVTLKRLEHFLTDSALSREQHRRLIGAAFERFRPPNPRAALGVSFEPLARESGVRIATVVAAFPASGLLKPGDRVQTFDGIPIRDQQHAVAIIVSHDPGDEIDIAIVREGESVTVRVPLGRRDLLDNPVPVSGQMLADAWDVRSRPYQALGEPAVIDPGLAPAVWVDAASPVMHTPPVVVAGGEPRGGFDPALVARDAQIRLGMDGAIRQQQQGVRLPNVRQPQNENLAIQRRLLRDSMDQLQTVIDQRRSLLRDPTLSPERRRQLEREIDQYSDSIRELDRAMRVIEGQMGPPR